MRFSKRTHECAIAALDYARQARAGLRMCGHHGLARDLDPVIEHLREIVREILRPEAGGAEEDASASEEPAESTRGIPIWSRRADEELSRAASSLSFA
jgi:hypothetical protein